jgi:hypothetical protein
MFTEANQSGYSPTQQHYWRFRNSGSMLLWETSPDASRWTTEASIAAPSYLGSLYFDLGAGASSATTSDLVARFDNFSAN